MLNKIALFVILAAALVLFFRYNQQEKDPNVLIVGTNAEFPPFTFRQNGEIVGFDIDVAKEVAKRLNKQVTFKDMPFEALIPDLTFGNIDFIAAGMTATEERAKRVAFSQCYLKDDPLVIVTLNQEGAAGKITLNDLKEKIVVVNEGYTADIYLSDKSDLTLTRLSAPADAFIALKNGRADAFVTAQTTVDSFLQEQDGSQFRQDVIEGVSETCALVIAKTNTEMLQNINRVLSDMEKDGTMGQLKNKWKLQ